jgi:hypothetical protein
VGEVADVRACRADILVQVRWVGLHDLLRASTPESIWEKRCFGGSSVVQLSWRTCCLVLTCGTQECGVGKLSREAVAKTDIWRGGLNWVSNLFEV